MCVYCEGEVDSRKYLLEENGTYIDGNGMITNDDTCEELKINYCPVCGTEL